MYRIQLNPEVLAQCRAEGEKAVREARKMRLLRTKAHRYDIFCFWRNIFVGVAWTVIFTAIVAIAGNI